LVLPLKIRIQVGVGSVGTSDGRGVLNIILHFEDLLLNFALKVIPRSYGLIVGYLALVRMRGQIHILLVDLIELLLIVRGLL